MAFVSEDHPDAIFCVTAYANGDDEEGATSYYTTMIEARSEFERLVKAKRFYSVYLGRWLSDVDGWRGVDDWESQS